MNPAAGQVWQSHSNGLEYRVLRIGVRLRQPDDTVVPGVLLMKESDAVKGLPNAQIRCVQVQYLQTAFTHLR